MDKTRPVAVRIVPQRRLESEFSDQSDAPQWLHCESATRRRTIRDHRDVVTGGCPGAARCYDREAIFSPRLQGAGVRDKPKRLW